MIDFFKLHKKDFDFKHFIKQALKEDIGEGDHTSLSTIAPNIKTKMHLLVKENGILAGMEVAKAIFKIVNPKLKFSALLKDGDVVKKGDVAFLVSGDARTLLTTERLVLNIMQRMSGIATKTHHMQSLCKGTQAKVIDTRKTTPGFRFFEKWAVVIGGGANHRYGLYDMIMIKDNHIDIAGGIDDAIVRTKAYLKKNKKKLAIEVESRNIEDVKKILAHSGIQRIMLDNYSVEAAKIAVKFIKHSVETECSGGITEDTIGQYAKTGVDFISIGALTHHFKSLDLSLKVIP